MPKKSKTQCETGGIPTSLIRKAVKEYEKDRKRPKTKGVATRSVAIPAPPPPTSPKYNLCIQKWYVLYQQSKALDGYYQQLAMIAQQQAALNQQIKYLQSTLAGLQQAYATCMGGFSV